MEPRLKNPASLIPEAMKPIQDLIAAAHSGGVPEETMELVHLRTSQINGCAWCVDAAGKSARKRGMDLDKVLAVAAWREAPYFSDAERAALALAEAATRLADRPDPVPDDIWEAAAQHHDDRQMASLVLWIAISNLFNRVNVPTRQVAGTWG